MAERPGEPSAPRTLTEALRRWTVDELEDLLTARPDLTYPSPRDLVDLSTRAATPSSATRAIDRLDAFVSGVAEALAALPPSTSVEAVIGLLDAPADAVREACGKLRNLALLWGPDDRLELVRGVRDCFGPYPGGLARPSPAPLAPAEIARRLDLCEPDVRPVLDRLLWAPAGQVRDAQRAVDPAAARTPVEQLLAYGLLRPVDATTVVLPREVALYLRGGRLTPEPVAPTPPPVPHTPGEAGRIDLVDRAAAGAAHELLHDLELAVEALDAAPHRLLRDGGVASRDTAGMARRLGLDVARATFLLEAAAAAGLVAGDPTGLLLPTTGFDRWAHAEPADRWQAVVDSWLQVPRRFAGASEPGGHALGPEAATTLPIADARALVLRLALDTGVGARLEPDGLLAALAWQRPRLTRLPDLAVLVREIWWEAGLLGLVSLGAVSSYTDALLAGNGVVPDRLRRLFPGTQSDLVLQADLTAVAPGPLPTGTARELRLLADQESRGGGGVFRFSGGSLRRAFRAGWSAAEVHDWLISHSTTGVPQPLAYLVDDVARQVGQVRVGFAGSFVRVDDPVVAAALLAAPEAAGLGLREVVPGVLVSLSEPAEVATVLQTLGHTPAVEDESGQVLNLPPRRRAVARSREERPEPASAREAAAAALAGETGERAAGSASAEDTEAILAQLASATAAARAVRVGYVAADGAAYERDLAPLDLGSGAVRGIDRQTAAVVTIPLARISSVRAT